jgi:hypothetical protein
MTKPRVLAILCTVLLIAPVSTSFAWATMNEPAQSTSSQGQGQELFSVDQLDSLVAPLALYPDPILSQVLVASTYPLEIVQASQWLNQNSSLSGKALADAAAQQPWDASVQALVMLPDLLHRLSKDIRWTSDVGDAFLAQEQDVMAAIQRMRQKAQQKGALQSNQQQTVNTTTANGQNYIVIEPAQPEVVYVPQYDPATIWGPPAYYPYPAIAYPPVFSVGAGFALGAIWAGGGWGGWGWNCGWGRNNITVNNNFINRNHFNRVNVANGNNWVHNPTHRGGAAYRNRDVANRYQGRTGSSSANRMRPGNPSQGARPGQGTPSRGGANRIGPGNPSKGGGQARPNVPSPGSANRTAPGSGNRSSGGGQARPNVPSRGNANRMAPSGGNRGSRSSGGGARQSAPRGGGRGGGRRR